jgi:hypothetical protein
VTLWESLTAYSETYTCYSAAVATWAAGRDEDWARLVNPGLWLSVTEEADGLFGFVHFPPGLRSLTTLTRRAADEPQDAIEGVLEELSATGRVIIAGDGFQLPWHVAHQRKHVPHWYVLTAEMNVVDPFACRNELGTQLAHQGILDREAIEPLLRALPGDDPVYELRERFALGDDMGARGAHGYQWFVANQADGGHSPAGVSGPDAIKRLSQHFRERGQEQSAYGQADDIWSIARHRAFLCRYAQELGGPDAIAWLEDHGTALAKRWAHMAPLIMQATLALGAGRSASASVPDTLAELAERERAAADALPGDLDACSI